MSDYIAFQDALQPFQSIFHRHITINAGVSGSIILATTDQPPKRRLHLANIGSNDIEIALDTHDGSGGIVDIAKWILKNTHPPLIIDYWCRIIYYRSVGGSILQIIELS